MTNDEFRLHAHEMVDWMADYLEHMEKYPVKPDLKPGDIKNQLPLAAPADGEDFKAIFADFKNIIYHSRVHYNKPAIPGFSYLTPCFLYTHLLAVEHDLLITT